jgi:hypothetical protein
MEITTFMRELIDPYWWAVALSSLVQFVLFVRWLYRRIRSDEITRTFVEDMATSHLPHIYRLLEKLCDDKGIETPPEPPIRRVSLNGPTTEIVAQARTIASAHGLDPALVCAVVEQESA